MGVSVDRHVWLHWNKVELFAAKHLLCKDGHNTCQWWPPLRESPGSTAWLQTLPSLSLAWIPYSRGQQPLLNQGGADGTSSLCQRWTKLRLSKSIFKLFLCLLNNIHHGTANKVQLIYSCKYTRIWKLKYLSTDIFLSALAVAKTQYIFMHSCFQILFLFVLFTVLRIHIIITILL